MQTDAELVHRFRTGEPTAFDELMARHRGFVYRWLLSRARRPEEAEDLTQQVLVKAHRGLHGFRGDSSFRVWLFRVATSSWASEARKIQPPELMSLEALLELELGEPRAPGPGPEEIAEQKELARVMLAAMDAMPGDYRDALRLFYLEGLSHGEIAEAQGWTVDKVKVTLHRARRKLREVLGNVECIAA